MAIDRSWYPGYPAWAQAEAEISPFFETDFAVADFSVAKLFYETAGAAALKYLTNITPLSILNEPAEILANIDPRSKGNNRRPRPLPPYAGRHSPPY